MHSNEKHPIDHLFARKLAQRQATPSPQLWQRLQQQLPAQRRGAVVPLWPRMLAAASVLLLLGWGLGRYSTQPSTPVASLPQQPAPGGASQQQPRTAAPQQQAMDKDTPAQPAAQPAVPGAPAPQQLAQASTQQQPTLSTPKEKRQKATRPSTASRPARPVAAPQAQPSATQLASALPPAKAKQPEEEAPSTQKAEQTDKPAAQPAPALALVESPLDEEATVEPVLIEIRTADGRRVRPPQRSLVGRLKQWKDQAVQAREQPLDAGRVLGRYASQVMNENE